MVNLKVLLAFHTYIGRYIIICLIENLFKIPSILANSLLFYADIINRGIFLQVRSRKFEHFYLQLSIKGIVLQNVYPLVLVICRVLGKLVTFIIDKKAKQL